MILSELSLVKIFIVMLCFNLLVNTGLLAQSEAHKRSDFAVIDPTYNFKTKVPQLNVEENSISWIYGPAELECWRLQLLRQRKDSAKLLVGYPGEFHVPYKNASYLLELGKQIEIDLLKFRAVGRGSIFLDGKMVVEFSETDSFHILSPSSKFKFSEIRFDLITKNEPPALLIEDEMISTSMNSWQWSTQSEKWQTAYHFPQTISGIPPHELENPTLTLYPKNVKNGLIDFGRELYGYVIVRNSQKPNISIGESISEALDTLNNVLEQSLEMVKSKDDFWRSKSPLAFRYIYTDIRQTDDVHCEAIFYPASYNGAFACSDSILTRIWMYSAYTLRLCMHDFILDGIKRDRLPWTGDLAMSLFANAYTFSDSEIVRRSLVALGRAGIKEKDINGIIDYSLWWVIAQDQYQLYFGDLNHLEIEWGKIKETLDFLTDRCDSFGFIKPDNTWLFIDWVEQEKWSALQILWWWAQESGARLAHRIGDVETERQLKSKAEKLKEDLRKNIWHEVDQLWLPGINPQFERTRHPNFLSVISGLATEDQNEGIKTALEDDAICQVGTPYMAGFESIALARLGNIQYMLDRVSRYWGGMMEQGATTFWEAYDEKDKNEEHYIFYDRPYGKSLCHAWSAGPAAFLPAELFGLRPLDDGWRSFSLNPNLGYLDWATVSVPTNFGDIRVNIDKRNIEISVPTGTSLEWKERSIKGPCTIKDVL